ncbi:DUF4367 domain-containing protein [Caproiciproducens sp.]|uniref:DUF4367 domain-containing protein n=1 Tax=Caproiciproducens sp. TaxID=1954376 RepID=UPI00289ECC6E|nr:DUF4367 domain-containing protein [Caproiciproducens sp.]
MNESEINIRLFDTLLKAAAAEDFQNELDALPSEQELNRGYALSEQLEKGIRSLIKESSSRNRRKKLSRLAKRAAVIAAIVIPISIGSLLSVEASRNAIFNSVLEWKAEHVDIHFQETTSGTSGEEPPAGERLEVWEPQYLPEGFFVAEEKNVGPVHMITYENGKGASVTFTQTPLDKAGKMSIDSEHTTYHEITIKGEKAVLFEATRAEDRSYVLWQSKKTSLVLSSAILKNELIRIAESVEPQK